MRAILCGAVIAFPAWAGGDSSDGHTHAAPEPVLAVAAAPRAIATTEEFEIVAILQGKQLVIYIDRFASNEPIVNAKVEVEGVGMQSLASETADGTYVINVAAEIPPGKHPLTISIEAGDTADLLIATLDISPVTAGTEHAGGWRQQIIWIVAGLLLAAGGWLAVRRNNKERKSE